MKHILEYPKGTRIEIPAFDNFKRYMDGMGFWADRPASRPGYISMVNGYQPLRPDLPTPQDFRFDVMPH